MKIIVETTAAAPIAEVWHAYVTPEDIKAWNAASDDWHTTVVSVDLREGGAFAARMETKDGSKGFVFAGTYTRIVPRERIEYVFGKRTAQVTFIEGTKGVNVRVAFDAETTFTQEQQRAVWQAILNNFARYVEGRRAS